MVCSLSERYCDCCELIGAENVGVRNANETSNEYSRLTCRPYRVCARSVVENVLSFNSTSSIQLIPVYMIIKLVSKSFENNEEFTYRKNPSIDSLSHAVLESQVR